MSHSIIRVENLGKRYVLGQQKNADKYSTLRDTLVNGTRALAKRFGRSNSQINSTDFWALKDVSFEIKQGDRVGIIGRNGAGKSTLLKILSRITEPTEGRVRIKGRVASLLEVGTGFHQELTGRENIFLNGSILGMSKVEIQKRLDEIVDFAEIEQFLDTPVKRYSSGMRVRLGFAVAAHLTPEILIIDEVLAVGDVAFQNKCLGKMEDVSTNEGRTILFVSHDMSVVEQLCSRGIVLDNGAVALSASSEQAISYYAELNANQKHELTGREVYSQTHQLGLSNPKVTLIPNKDDLDLEVSIVVNSRLEQNGVGISVNISNMKGKVASIGPRLHRQMLPPFIGSYTYTLKFSAITQCLAGGQYFISFILLRPKVERILNMENILEFSLPAPILYPKGVPYTSQEFGAPLLKPEVVIEKIPSQDLELTYVS